MTRRKNENELRLRTRPPMQDTRAQTERAVRTARDARAAAEERVADEIVAELLRTLEP